MKKKLLRNTTVAIIALFMAAVALPQSAIAQKITILGAEYNESTVLTPDGGGTIKWDKEHTTLTISNISLSTTQDVIWNDANIEDLKVVLQGSNTISGTGYIVYNAVGNITIMGSGSLTAHTTDNNAIYISNKSANIFTIKDCTLDVQGKLSSICGYRNGEGTETTTLVVNNATLKVKGSTAYSGIRNLKAYELKKSHIETSGVKFGKASNGSYELVDESGKTYTGEVTIAPDVVVTTGNATIPAPVAGEHPSFTATSSDPDKFIVKVVKWTDATTDHSVDSDHTFIEGQKYCVVIKFKGAEGYTCSYDNSFTINDQPTWWSGNGLQRGYTFTCNTTTGIDAVTIDDSKPATPVYNLQGIMVKRNADDLSGLPAGIYIVDGKKISVK